MEHDKKTALLNFAPRFCSDEMKRQTDEYWRWVWLGMCGFSLSFALVHHDSPSKYKCSIGRWIPLPLTSLVLILVPTEVEGNEQKSWDGSDRPISDARIPDFRPTTLGLC